MSLILSFGWLVALLGRGVLSPLLPSIIDTLSITSTQAGLGLIVMMALHSIIQYPAGSFSDHLTRTTILAGSLSVLSFGFLILSASMTYISFLAGVAAVGLGTGLYFTPQRAMLSDLFEERRGQAFGLNFSAGSVGSALSAGVAVVVLSVATWRAAFLPLVVATLVVLIALHLQSRESYELAWVTPDVASTVGRIRASPELVWLIVAYALFSFTWQGVFGFLPTYLQVGKAFTPTIASAGFALLFVVAIVVMPIAGNISDRISRPTVAIVGLSLGILGLVALVFTASIPAVAAGIVLFAVGVRAFPPVMQAHIMDLVPDENTGGDFGAIKTVYTLLGSAGPLYVGFVSEWATYSVAFGGLVACLVLSVLILVYSTNRRVIDR
jgi:MFS family permease